MKRRSFIIIIISLVVVVGVIWLNQLGLTNNLPQTMTGTIMGTSYHIRLAAQDAKIDIGSLEEKIRLRLDGIDNKMSTYKKDSDISRFNRNSSYDWVPASVETMTVIDAAQAISRQSNGAFDITIGKLVNLWGFGPTVNIETIPDSVVVHNLQTQVGYHHLELRQTPPALRKDSQEIYLDLSAIAKGYAVDAVARLLLGYGINNFLVEIGGEIVTHGQKTPKNPWVIGIETPKAEQRSIRKRLQLHNIAMATSGDYRNYFEYQGVRYSHTIDPSTGYPIKHQLASVTVIAPTCMRADALATALMVMGPEKGLAFAEEEHLPVLMLVKQGDRFIEKQSSAFKSYLEEREN